MGELGFLPAELDPCPPLLTARRRLMGSLLGFGLCLKRRTSLIEPEALLPHKRQGSLCPGHHLLPSPDAGSQIRCHVCAGWSPLRTESPHPPPSLEEEGQGCELCESRDLVCLAPTNCPSPCAGHLALGKLFANTE